MIATAADLLKRLIVLSLFKKKLSALDAAQMLVLLIGNSLERRISAQDEHLAEAITRIGEQRSAFEWLTLHFFVVDLTVRDHLSEDRELGKVVRDHLMAESLKAYSHVITSTPDFLQRLEDYRAAWNHPPNENRLESVARRFAISIEQRDILVTASGTILATAVTKAVRQLLGGYRIAK